MGHSGGCLCGAVRYEVEGELAPIQLCRCGQCRKAQGGAFGANIPVRATDFQLIRGEDALRDYRASPDKRRVFCGVCGGPVYSQRDDAPHTLRLRVGGLDDTEGLRVGLHIQTSSRAAWWLIDDDLPNYLAAGPG